MKRKKIREKAYINDDEYYFNIIRKNIKKIRESKNLTQQDLADMIEKTRQYICDIENENRHKHPTIPTIGRIAEALEIDITDLFIPFEEK